MTLFRILGPVEVCDGDRRLAIGGPQQRALLALLLIDRNRPVSAERLIDHLWGASPPDNARALLHSCVASLRRALDPLRGRPGPRLLTQAHGYLLRVEPGELDLDRFVELDEQASRVVGHGPAGAQQAADLWGQALALWRGPALDDLTLDACRRETARLDELRVTVLEKTIDAGLRSHRAADLVGELGSHVARYPLRERLWAQLMVALHETGQRAQALAAYRRLRDLLVDELGVEPGPAVRDLQQILLTDGDVLAGYLRTEPAPGMAGRRPDTSAGSGFMNLPAQLPRASPGFAGRQDSLSCLDQLLDDVSEQTAVCVVTGMAGVGKTALAVHWAQRVSDRFPDGQLYVNLRGYAATPPATPAEALSGFLRALGVLPERLPDDPAQAAAQYRSLLAGKRVLVLLDDARSAGQVRPLLPGGHGCLVLVTSRDSLGGLVVRDGARHLTLDVLDRDDALELLTAVLGAKRVRSEPEAAASLVDLCARLPLALRIVTGRLLIHPARRLADEVADLSCDERLAALAVHGDEESVVRVVFERSYAAASADSRRLFRLLGLVPLRDLTATTAAALVNATPAHTADLLDELANAHLLTRPSPGRFGLHDLLGLYAAERVGQDEPAADRAEAARRLLLRLLTDADAADRLLNPNRIRLPLPSDSPDPVVHEDHGAALSWLDAECANLVTAVRYAAQHGPRAAAWLLASTLRGHHELRMRTQDWRDVAMLGLGAAEAEGDDRARALVHLSLAGLHERLGDYRLAGLQSGRALVLARRAGWRAAEGVALSELGILYRHAGRLEKATVYATEALEVARGVEWLPLLAGRLMSLGNLRAEAGDLGGAAELYSEVLPLFRQIGTHTGEAIALANLGECRVALGHPDEAVAYFTAASQLNREVGHRSLAADNLRALAAAHLEAGRPAAAVELAEAALSEHRITGDRRYEAGSLNVLGAAHRRLDDIAQAIQNHRQALEISRVIGVRRHEVTALIGLAHCAERLGRLDEARRHAEESLALARHDGLRLLEGPALTALAAILLASGDLAAAAVQAGLALSLQRQTRQRLGEARALRLLGAVAARRGEHEEAACSYRWAHRLCEEAGVHEANVMGR